MFDPWHYLTFILASFVVTLVPGPTITVIVANSLRSGVRAGLLNVAGTQFGVLTMLLVIAFGLEMVLARLPHLLDSIRLIGAVYLAWLGTRLLVSRGRLVQATAGPHSSFFWQGFLVLWSNPKALLFLGAFLPQFIEPASDTLLQTALLGVTFIAIASSVDSGYAIIAGTVGGMLSHAHIRRLEWIIGLLLIAGGLWLLLKR